MHLIVRVVRTVLLILEKVLTWLILIVLTCILFLSFIDVVYEIQRMVMEPPVFVIPAAGLMELFSLFLIILIGLELLETVKAYLDHDVVHVELVLLVAIIAVARKVIVWDFEKYTEIQLMSLGVIVVSLAIAYYLIRTQGRIPRKRIEQASSE